MATAIYAKDEEANGALCQAQRRLPAARQPASGGGDRGNQPHPPGLGELLSDRSCEPMFFEGQRLGSDEDQAPSDAIQIAQRQRMETVEWGVDESAARPIQRL